MSSFGAVVVSLFAGFGWCGLCCLLRLGVGSGVPEEGVGR